MNEKQSLEHEQVRGGKQLKLINQIQKFQKQVSSNLKILSFEQKKEIVRLLVKEVIVSTKTGEIIVQYVVSHPKKLPLCPGTNSFLSSELLALKL